MLELKIKGTPHPNPKKSASRISEFYRIIEWFGLEDNFKIT